MKLVKKHLTLVICAVVVILSIASVFYPFGSLTSEVQAKANERYTSQSGNINSLKDAKLTLPGMEKPLTGVPTDNLIKAKREINKNMADQAAEIVKNGAEANRRGRVEIDDANGHVTPLLPLPKDKLDYTREPNFLPVIVHEGVNADSMQFKEDYAKIFPVWTERLVGSHIVPVPPRPDELTAAYADFTAKRNASLPGAQPAAQGADQHEEQEFDRKKIMETAAGIHMYIDSGAFQVRPWLTSDSPPTEQMMFEALVDSWYQSDVVAAIAAVNDEALKGKEATDKNVGFSPIKRLMHIAVGNDSLIAHTGTWTTQGAGVGVGGNIGPLFFLPNMLVGATPDAAAPAAGTAQPNTTDMTRSMTGRASGSDYDVVLMQISIDIDPSYLNKFIDQLYRRNMGYTLLSVKSHTIDPLDRAGNGYIYGETQVDEVELLVEGLLFRTWTQPIMPDAVRTQLGIPPDPAKP